MSAETELVSALNADSGVTALIAGRVYPNDAPQESTTFPRIVYERLSTEEKTTIHDGEPFAARVSLVAAAWATTRRDAEQLADAMLPAIRNLATVTNRFGHFEPQTATHAAVLEFEVWEL